MIRICESLKRGCGKRAKGVQLLRESQIQGSVRPKCCPGEIKARTFLLQSADRGTDRKGQNSRPRVVTA